MFFESDTFPFKFMLETCVYFDFWNKNVFKIFKKIQSVLPMIWGIFHFLEKIKI